MATKLITRPSELFIIGLLLFILMAGAPVLAEDFEVTIPVNRWFNYAGQDHDVAVPYSLDTDFLSISNISATVGGYCLSPNGSIYVSTADASATFWVPNGSYSWSGSLVPYIGPPYYESLLDGTGTLHILTVSQLYVGTVRLTVSGTPAMPPLNETASTEASLVEMVIGEEAVLENVAVTGDFNSILDFNSFEIVTIATGPFGGKGFSKARYETTLDGISYTGNWQGALFLEPEERKIYLKGAISGEIAATVEGYLTESVSESGIYNQYQATWKIGQLGGVTKSATISLNGNLSYAGSSEFPDTELYILQTNIEGTITGDCAGPLSTIITHTRIADGNNPYDGEGFSIISYVSDSGSGQGWTYDKLVSPGTVELKGLFTNPLFSIVSGTLDETELPRSLLLTLQRVDLGLPPAPDLKVKTWGPTRVSPGQTVDYIIEYRNDGLFKAAEDIDIVMKLPYDVKFISATGEGIYSKIAHEIQWNFGNIPPLSRGELSSNVEVLWGLTSGTSFEVIASIPKEGIEIITDPTVVTSFEVLEATEDYLESRLTISNQSSTTNIDMTATITVVPEEIVPRFSYIEKADGIEASIELTMEGNSFTLLALGLVVGGTYLWSEALEEYAETFKKRENLNTWLEEQDTISEQGHKNLQAQALSWFYTEASVSLLDIPIGLPVGEAVMEVFGEDEKAYNVKVGEYIAENMGYPLPPETEVASRIREAYKLYTDECKRYLTPISHDVDTHENEIAVARDPSVKYGPEGLVSPGQRLNYTVEYENEGEGIAFGVYFTDTLDEALDDSTLEIGPVIDVNDGSLISGPGTYNPATRTISWFAGEVGPSEGGYAVFDVNVVSDANHGTEIINYATIYFPSVPEETRTNGIVSIVSLNQPPVADAGDDQIVEQESYAGTEVTLDGSGSTDPDSTPGTNDDIVSFDWYQGDTLLGSGETIDYTFPLGSHTVTLLVTDSFGETDEDEAIIVVQDTTPPVIICPPDVTLECPADTSAAATGSGGATDNCDPSPTIVFSDLISGACPKVIERTWMATDASGNSSSCVQVITVQDTTPPVINGPGNVMLECPANTSVIANGSATATDACGSVTITHSDVWVPVCGNTGTLTRTWTATDECGNSSSCVQTITVVDTTPPEFEFSVTPTVLWPPNHKMVLITPSWIVSDICDDSLEVSLASITTNEDDEINTYDPIYDNTVGDGHTADDIQIIDGNIYLRAERSGTGTDRVYTITYRAVDDCGNAAESSATVTVPHDQR